MGGWNDDWDNEDSNNYAALKNDWYTRVIRIYTVYICPLNLSHIWASFLKLNNSLGDQYFISSLQRKILLGFFVMRTDSELPEVSAAISATWEGKNSHQHG